MEQTSRLSISRGDVPSRRSRRSRKRVRWPMWLWCLPADAARFLCLRCNTNRRYIRECVYSYARLNARAYYQIWSVLSSVQFGFLLCPSWPYVLRPILRKGGKEHVQYTENERIKLPTDIKFKTVSPFATYLLTCICNHHPQSLARAGN